MNILYICNPGAIHDQKWISFFSKQKDIKQFATWEDENNAIAGNLNFFTDNNIVVLPSYPSFSLKRLYKTMSAVKHLNRLIRQHAIDAVHILFAAPHALYVPFLKVPVIITTRGSDILKAIPELQSSAGIRKWHDRTLYYLFRRAFKDAAFITGTSQKQLDKAKELFAVPDDRCVLIRTGVDVEGIQNITVADHLPAALTGKKIIFSPRWMYPQYNVETQIEAIKLLDKNILAEFTFGFIQGKDVFLKQEPYFSEMRKKLDEVAGLHYVIFEKLSQREVWACFRQAAVSFMVPLSDGTPSSAIEAMVARCKLIIGNVGYDSVLFKDTCMVVDKTNALQLAQAIETALSNYPGELLEKAYHQATTFGNRTTEMNKVLTLYRRLSPSN